MMLNMVLFGPPGSGKGTQAAKLAEKYNMISISTGNLLRNEISKKTELGLEVKQLVDKGCLVPDNTILNIIKENVDANIRKQLGNIFDGFPRTTRQAQDLDNLLENYNASITIVISLIVKDEEIKNRLLKRSKELNRSDDSSLEVIENRIKEYYNKTTHVSQFYKEQGKLFEINGSDDIDTVFNNIVANINRHIYDRKG